MSQRSQQLFDPSPREQTMRGPRLNSGGGGHPGGLPPRSPRHMGDHPGEVVHVQDRVLRNILKNSTASEYVRPAGCYMNKNQERFEIKLEEQMHDLNKLHDTIAQDHTARGEPEDEDNTIAKQIDARATQVKNFLDMSKKLAIPKAYYDPRYSKMDNQAIVDEVVKSRNYGARMRNMRMARARIMLNSSEGVQACVSPRDGYASQGNADQFWTTKAKADAKEKLFTITKRQEDKVNHMVRNPTTYHINHMIRNGSDHRTMWRNHNWTNVNGHGHHATTKCSSGGHHYHGAPKVASKHWSHPYKPSN